MIKETISVTPYNSSSSWDDAATAAATELVLTVCCCLGAGGGGEDVADNAAFICGEAAPEVAVSNFEVAAAESDFSKFAIIKGPPPPPLPLLFPPDKDGGGGGKGP